MSIAWPKSATGMLSIGMNSASWVMRLTETSSMLPGQRRDGVDPAVDGALVQGVDDRRLGQAAHEVDVRGDGVELAGRYPVFQLRC